jgi:hypothetical protein
VVFLFGIFFLALDILFPLSGELYFLKRSGTDFDLLHGGLACGPRSTRDGWEARRLKAERRESTL